MGLKEAFTYALALDYLSEQRKKELLSKNGYPSRRGAYLKTASQVPSEETKILVVWSLVFLSRVTGVDLALKKVRQQLAKEG